MTDILRDVREARPKKKEDGADISPFSAIEEFQKKVQAVIEGEGSPEERTAKVYLAALGIDYDSLTHEEFVVLIGILEKSKLKGNSVSRRGRNRPVSHKRRKK